ncbi:MAG: aminotransferase class V-fold PLP-dependent enzyme [Leptospiraceae bacterium]|nr:aminotransferase class V-fold PLP-dependent enzyme [Leptospiraceae bacterium]
MDISSLVSSVKSFFFRGIKSIPVVRERIQKEYNEIMKSLEGSLKPYKGKFASFKEIPREGKSQEDILQIMKEIKDFEESRWKDGYVSGAVYHGDEKHIDFLNKVYSIHSQTNPLHSDLWPSIGKYEAEVVAMTSFMLGADNSDNASICGTLSSGGTESILLAMKTYRDWARDTKGIHNPEVVLPITAHAAFDKASEYFHIKLVKIPIESDYRVNIEKVKNAISKNTIAIVGSAPSFPHGVIDPIEELSEIAREHGVGFHTDACLGGFLLPFAEKLGYQVPVFDFRLPGVTSISVDTHKYGYAAKGISVILYRTKELRRYQYFKITEWPGGIYFSPSFAGSRPGALSAMSWAAMVNIGEKGYMANAKKILETANKIKNEIKTIPDLFVLGDPLFNVSFSSHTIDIYKVMESMTHKNWSLNGLHKPSCVHICVTLRHAQEGVAERFITDLRESVAYVKAHPSEKGEMAPVYGMAATIPDRTAVADLLDMYMDLLYKIE